jgi:hypothetical protein
VKVEERLFKNVDIIALAGAPNKAVTLETAQVSIQDDSTSKIDGFLDLTKHVVLLFR